MQQIHQRESNSAESIGVLNKLVTEILPKLIENGKHPSFFYHGPSDAQHGQHATSVMHMTGPEMYELTMQLISVVTEHRLVESPLKFQVDIQQAMLEGINRSINAAVVKEADNANHVN